jgi:predicted phosphohydrolase
MKKFVRYTDTHLNFAWSWERRRFAAMLVDERPDGILLTGDISDGRLLVAHLNELAANLACPIYFVLGNHDFWHKGFEQTYAEVQKMTAKTPNLIWLTLSPVISLTEDVALVGTEGWYDGLAANPRYLDLTWDWLNIKELRHLTRLARLDYYRELSRLEAVRMEDKLRAAVVGHKEIVVMTHIPPWAEAAPVKTPILSHFKVFRDCWTAYDVSVHMGQSIERVAKEFPEKKFRVLAGHTHVQTWVQVAPNIEVHVNRAKYLGKPGDAEHLIL